MTNKDKAIRLAPFLIITLILVSVTFAGLKLGIITPLSPLSLSKSVPVEIGYSQAQEYWILTSVLNEKEAFKMTLPSDTSTKTDAETSVKSANEISVVITPELPYSTTGLLFLNERFIYWKNLFGEVKNDWVPGYDIDDSSWLTTAGYRVDVYKNAVFQAGKSVKINFKEPTVIEIPVEGGKVVTINNLGMIPQGVGNPSGNLVAVQDTRSTWSKKMLIWNMEALTTLIKDWNQERFYKTGTWSWADVLNYADQAGRMPQSVPLTYFSAPSFEDSTIKLTYTAITFAGLISAYIPASLAETITIKLYAPKPVIVSVSPSQLPSTREGTSTPLSVSVRNDGTEGTVSVSVTSSFYQFIATKPASIDMKEKATVDFTFNALALEVDKDETPSISIFVQGRGGSDTKSILGAISNIDRSPDAAPDVPEADYTPRGGFNPFDLFNNLFKNIQLLMLGIGILTFIIMVIGVTRRRGK